MFIADRKSSTPSQPAEPVVFHQSEKHSKRIRSGLVRGFLVVFVLGAGSGLASLSYTRATALVAQSHQTLDQLHGLRSALAALDQATALFVIDGNEATWVARDHAQQRALEESKNLRGLADGHGALKRSLEIVTSAVQARIDQDNSIAVARQTQGAQAATAVLHSEQSRRTDEDVEHSVAQSETLERAILAHRTLAEQWHGRINLIAIVTGSVLALMVISQAGIIIKGALVTLQTGVADERLALDHLRSLNERLEERVAERTTAAEQRALELAHAQNALYRQTRLLRSLLTSMADAVMVCDKQKKLLEINPAAERIMGREIRTIPLDQWATRFELLTATGGKPISRDDWPLIRAARGEEVQATWLLRQGDKSRWIEGSAGPIRDDNGSILGAAMVFRDITDRRQAAEELRQALEEGDRARALLAAEKQRNAA